LRVPNLGKQGTRLAVNAHAAQGMTRWMVGQYAIPACLKVGDSQFINEIFGEFVNSSTHCLGARGPDGIILK
jgi:hypothetical protein